MPRIRSMTQNRSARGPTEKKGANEEEMKPLVVEASGVRSRSSSRDVPLGDDDKPVTRDNKPISFLSQAIASNPELFKQTTKFAACFCGLQASYLTWGYMQELIMTTRFNATERVPNGHFPSAAFCVFSNRFLAVIVAAVAVRIKHGSVFRNNVAPIWAFTPCALSNTMSSWSQYASLKVRRVRREYKRSHIVESTPHTWTLAR
jgi:UAA transporter family